MVTWHEDLLASKDILMSLNWRLLCCKRHSSMSFIFIITRISIQCSTNQIKSLSWTVKPHTRHWPRFIIDQTKLIIPSPSYRYWMLVVSLSQLALTGKTFNKWLFHRPQFIMSHIALEFPLKINFIPMITYHACIPNFN